ncbi:NlpC/P60 family protein [Chelativorans sp. AA-79]|uniref:NlpC/P60 family protein n=1 Tax=Chelativorans sp. AA-79 TaxID=3028735 RepID=UPI0023F74C0A|nr:NlpC/P60 family protein [Chelativorans sp. AA-79]WEX07366.1 NlpC/P60 family protein [Chelativorans sp. AA-79]
MDFSRYVGLPWTSGGRSFDGIDCWGLVWLFYRHEKSIEIPDYSEAYDDATDRERISGLMTSGVVSWVEVPAMHGAVALMRRGRAPSHVGIVAPGRKLLHIESTTGLSCIAPITADIERRTIGHFLLRSEL